MCTRLPQLTSCRLYHLKNPVMTIGHTITMQAWPFQCLEAHQVICILSSIHIYIAINPLLCVAAMILKKTYNNTNANSHK